LVSSKAVGQASICVAVASLSLLASCSESIGRFSLKAEGLEMYFLDLADADSSCSGKHPTYNRFFKPYIWLDKHLSIWYLTVVF